MLFRSGVVKVKLTAVNGNAIAYDAIGNPLNDGTWTYTWQNGRQLQKMQKAGVTVEFVYNADGLRVQKTVNGVATKYTLHGKNIVHMTSGTDELHFFYDAQNRPAVVVYNGTAYAYVKSLQGDIVAILDENGNTVVSYGYDAWGAPLWCTGELAETLGTVQPFRYRGYVFDEETGLYYLRSRYYNPWWGRFVNADAEIAVEAKLWDAKLFLYCANNPVRYTDDGGNSFWDVLADCGKALLVAAVVVAVVAVVIAATGGGGGFALAAAGGEIISGAAVADAAMTTAVAAEAAGASLMFASKLGKEYEDGNYSNHTKLNNVSENEKFEEALRRLKRDYNLNLNRGQRRRLHDEITGMGYSILEIVAEGWAMFGG